MICLWNEQKLLKHTVHFNETLNIENNNKFNGIINKYNLIQQKIYNITRKYHDATIKCIVFNDVGNSEEIETLEITCKY